MQLLWIFLAWVYFIFFVPARLVKHVAVCGAGEQCPAWHRGEQLHFITPFCMESPKWPHPPEIWMQQLESIPIKMST